MNSVFRITTFSDRFRNHHRIIWKSFVCGLTTFVHRITISRQWEREFFRAYVLVTFPVVSVNTSSMWLSYYPFPYSKLSNSRNKKNKHNILCDIDVSIVWVFCCIICTCMTVYPKNCCEWNKWAARKRDNMFDGCGGGSSPAAKPLQHTLLIDIAAKCSQQ